MIKIEKLYDNCEAVINGSERLLEGQLITIDELNTMKVKTGSIMYSVNETDLVTVSANPAVEQLDNSSKGSNPDTSLFLETISINDFKSSSDSDTSLILEAANNPEISKPASIKPVVAKPKTIAQKPKS